MGLSVLELTAMLGELQPLVGAQVQKLRVPTPRSATLELRLPGVTHQLLLSAEPEDGRLHVADERPASPPMPLAFQGLLRAHLDPSYVEGLVAVPGDRIALVKLTTKEGPRTLVAELTGRAGNLYLLGPDGRILGAGLPSAARLPQGAKWTPPPPPAPRPPRPSSLLDAAGMGPFSMSRAVEARFGPVARDRALAERRKTVTQAIAAKLARVRRAQERSSEDLAKAEGADTLRAQAELLKPLLSRLPRGADHAVCTDWSTGEAVEIVVPLRPELSAKQNLEKLFARYRRLNDARGRISERGAALRAEEEALVALSRRADAAESEGELDELERQALAAPRASERRGDAPPKPPFRAFRDEAGRPIWVGRSAAQNDRLTFGVAKGTDLWLHARGATGAHVVVPLPRGGEPDRETLLDAAHLALHHSALRGERLADVQYCRIRMIRRVRGAPPGAVQVTEEEVLPVRLDDERLGRLLAQAPD